MRLFVLFIVAALVLSCTDPTLAAWKTVASYRVQDEPSGQDYWKSPAEFRHDGGGDCEDFALALQALLGRDAYVVLVDDPTRPATWHALVGYRGRLMEPQVYGKYVSPLDVHIERVYDFNVQLYVQLYHRRPNDE